MSTPNGEIRDVEIAVEPRLIKALGHPLRQRILVTLKDGGVASPSDIARKLGEPLGNVSYHFKVLAECEAIELVKTEAVQGAIQHFYRASAGTLLDDAHWAELPLSSRRAIGTKQLQDIWDDVTEAVRTGGFDDVRTHISRAPLELDEEAYTEMTEQLRVTLERAMELHAESLARLANLPPDERQSRRTKLAILHFLR